MAQSEIPVLSQLARELSSFEESRKFPFPIRPSQLDELTREPGHTSRVRELAQRMITAIEQHGGAPAPLSHVPLIIDAIGLHSLLWQRMPLGGVSTQQTHNPMIMIRLELRAFEEYVAEHRLQGERHARAQDAFLLPYALKLPLTLNAMRMQAERLERECQTECLVYEAIMLYDRLTIAEETRLGTDREHLLRDEVTRHFNRLVKLAELLPGFGQVFFTLETRKQLMPFRGQFS